MNHQIAALALDAFAGVPDAEILKSATSTDIESVLRLYERLTADLRLVESTIALEKYQLSMVADPIERALRESIYAARSIITHRRIIDIRCSLSAIEDWLDRNLSQANNGDS